jgi:teichuronic acid biosynthesis glycosyltransferase TuaC
MSDRLRVLVLSRSYPSDLLPTLGLWVERPTVLLAESCDVRVVSAVPWWPPLPGVGPLRQYARFRGIPRHEVRDGVEIVRPRFLAGLGRSLYTFEARATYHGIRGTVDRMRERFPFDLIHAHMIYPEGAISHRLARRYGVPFVVTEHAPWTEQWFAHSAVRREALAAARAAASLLPVSTSVRDTIASYTGDPKRLRVIPVGVDPEAFPLGSAEGRAADQILFAGWINYTKGIDVLLRAIELIERRGQPGRLLLAGGAIYRDTRLQEEQLRALADSLELGDRVTFLGHRPPAEIARLMAESAVVVLPSRAESFGAVLVEALASGTPVVATRCGGPEDIVNDDVGILVPPEDPEELADALVTVLERRERYRPAALREHAVSHFGLERVAEQVHAAYLQAVGRLGETTVLEEARA